MHAASEPSDHDAGGGDSGQSAGDPARRKLWAMEQPPSDEPVPEVEEAPVRRPIIGLFTRLAFLSKDTGRWHRLTGGRDNHGDEPAAERDGEAGS
jgi:hypothetical protein